MMLWTDTYLNVYNGVVPLVRGNTIHAGTTTVFWKIISFLVAFLILFNVTKSSIHRLKKRRKQEAFKDASHIIIFKQG